MSKRRTRSQKIKAQQNGRFKYAPLKEAAILNPKPSVKSYFSEGEKAKNEKIGTHNSSVLTEEYANLKLIKKDLIKSLTVASFILCLIVVIYLLWYK